MHDAALFVEALIPSPLVQPPREIADARRALSPSSVRHRWDLGARSLALFRLQWSDGAPESGGIPKFFQRGAAAE